MRCHHTPLEWLENEATKTLHYENGATGTYTLQVGMQNATGFEEQFDSFFKTSTYTYNMT